MLQEIEIGLSYAAGGKGCREWKRLSFQPWSSISSNERRGFMEDLHGIFTKFKEDFPKVYSGHEEMGAEIHERSGPLPEKIRWLLKIAVSGASRHPLALETHIARAREAGVRDDEIKHALLLLIQTVGFPTFMEAYSIFKKMEGT
jgi:4-carboxymuconolactone decarboxylase